MEPELVEAIAHVLVVALKSLPGSWAEHVAACVAALSLVLVVVRAAIDRWGPRDNAKRAWIDAADMLLDKVALNSKPLAQRPMRPRKEKKQ